MFPGPCQRPSSGGCGGRRPEENLLLPLRLGSYAAQADGEQDSVESFALQPPDVDMALDANTRLTLRWCAVSKKRVHYVQRRGAIG